jgi:hypothetical protein
VRPAAAASIVSAVMAGEGLDVGVGPGDDAVEAVHDGGGCGVGEVGGVDGGHDVELSVCGEVSIPVLLNRSFALGRLGYMVAGFTPCETRPPSLAVLACPVCNRGR